MLKEPIPSSQTLPKTVEQRSLSKSLDIKAGRKKTSQESSVPYAQIQQNASELSLAVTEEDHAI